MINNSMLVPLLCFYGLFLICCGITAVIFIGMKAKTALLSGGLSGSVILLNAYLVSQNIKAASWFGIIFSLGLFGVFSWRASKTLFSIFTMISKQDQGLNGKGIAFLIISLMAIFSLFVFATQVILLSLTEKV